MARDFASASSQLINLPASVYDWEYTQAWSVACWVRTKTNASGVVLAKEEGSGNFRGWATFVRGGTSSPQFNMEVSNIGASKRAAARTTSEFTTGTYRSAIYTYDGSGVVAGMHIYVNGVDQALTTIQNNLASSTIKNSVNAQIGCRGGSGAPNLPVNCLMRRLLLYSAVLSSGDRAIIDAGTDVPTTNLVGWWDFDAYDDGATLVTDRSGNGAYGAVVGATYSTTDP